MSMSHVALEPPAINPTPSLASDTLGVSVARSAGQGVTRGEMVRYGA